MGESPTPAGNVTLNSCEKAFINGSLAAYVRGTGARNSAAAMPAATCYCLPSVPEHEHECALARWLLIDQRAD